MITNRPIRILSVCDDDHLGQTRELVLKIAGYEVESYPTDLQLDESLAKSFDVAILCHSLGEDGASELALQLRQLNSRIGIIRIEQFATRLNKDGYDERCSIEQGPEGLLNSVTAVLSTKAA